MAALNLNLQRLCNLFYELHCFIFGQRYGMFHVRQYHAVQTGYNVWRQYVHIRYLRPQIPAKCIVLYRTDVFTKKVVCSPCAPCGIGLFAIDFVDFLSDQNTPDNVFDLCYSFDNFNVSAISPTLNYRATNYLQTRILRFLPENIHDEYYFCILLTECKAFWVIFRRYNKILYVSLQDTSLLL